MTEIATGIIPVIKRATNFLTKNKTQINSVFGLIPNYVKIGVPVFLRSLHAGYILSLKTVFSK